MTFKIVDNFLNSSDADKIEYWLTEKKIIDFQNLPENVPKYPNLNLKLFQTTKSFTKMLMLKNEFVCLDVPEIHDLISILLSNILNTFKIKFVVSSVRINFMNKLCAKPTLKYDVPHVDIMEVRKNMYTLMYYVNDSDGNTILYNETCKGSLLLEELDSNFSALEIVPPRKNRLLIFNAYQLHSAPAYCTENRYIINLNITTEYPIL